MFRVEYRLSGDHAWRTGNLPVSIQAAQTQARVTSERIGAEQVRIVQAGQPTHLVDLKA